MMTWMKWAASLLALVGTITSGWLFLDMRYAKAGEVQQQVDEVKSLYLKSERRELQRQKFDLEVAKEQRKLTPLEKQRVQQLDQQQKDVESAIQRIERAK